MKLPQTLSTLDSLQPTGGMLSSTGILLRSWDRISASAQELFKIQNLSSGRISKSSQLQSWNLSSGRISNLSSRAGISAPELESQLREDFKSQLREDFKSQLRSWNLSSGVEIQISAPELNFKSQLREDFKSQLQS